MLGPGLLESGVCEVVLAASRMGVARLRRAVAQGPVDAGERHRITHNPGISERSGQSFPGRRHFPQREPVHANLVPVYGPLEGAVTGEGVDQGALLVEEVEGGPMVPRQPLHHALLVDKICSFGRSTWAARNLA